MSGTIETPCAQCGKTVRRFRSQVSNSARVFCDRICQGAYKSEHARGTSAANWRGGQKRDRSYIVVLAPWAACSDTSGYAPLHRLVMEIMLGRALAPGEVVHHRD